MSADDLVVSTVRRMFADARDRDAAERPAADVLDERLWSALVAGGYLELLSGDLEDAEAGADSDGAGSGLALAVEVARLAARFACRAPVTEGVLLGPALQQLLPGAVVGQTALVRSGEDAVTTPARWGRAAETVAIVDGERLRLYEAAQLACRRDVNLAGEAWDSFVVDPSVRQISEVTVGVNDAWMLRVLEELGRLGSLAGAAQGAHEATVEYARTREQFGRAIGSFQAVAHSIACMTADRAALECAVAAAVDAARRTPHDELIHAAAKVQAVRSAGRIAAVAHQVHGAIGMTMEHSLRLSTTRLWSLRNELGSEAVTAAHVAASIGSEDVWELLTAADEEPASASIRPRS